VLALRPACAQLHTSDTALLVDEANNTSQRLDVIVFPDTKVLWANAPFGENGRRFGHHKAGSADSTAAQVHEVPIRRITVGAGVLAHR